jgi:hypothetical protein
MNENNSLSYIFVSLFVILFLVKKPLDYTSSKGSLTRYQHELLFSGVRKVSTQCKYDGFVSFFESLFSYRK